MGGGAFFSIVTSKNENILYWYIIQFDPQFSSRPRKGTIETDSLTMTNNTLISGKKWPCVWH
jgi:hypothetical protein